MRLGKLLYCLAVLSIGVVILAGSAQAQWGSAALEPVSTGPENDRVGRSALALDEYGTLHALFDRWPGAGDHDFYYTRKPVGGAWSVPVPVGDHAQQNQYPYLAVHGESGTPYVVYLENGFLKLGVGWSTGWQYYDLLTPYVNQLIFPALYVDAGGYAHVAVIEETGGVYKMCYGYWDGPVSNLFYFQIIQNSQLGAYGGGADPDICVRSDGSAVISYRGGDYLSYQIHVAENASLGGTQWDIQTVSLPSYQCYSSSVKRTPNDDLYLALHGDLGFGMPAYAFFTTKPVGAKSWLQPLNVSGNLRGGGVKLAVEDDGTSHIVFDEVSGNIYTGNICFTSNVSGTWKSEILLKTEKYAPSFVMDHAGCGSLLFEEYAGSKDFNIYYYGFVQHKGLLCDTFTIPESTGGAVNFTLDAGAVNANRNYLMLGGISGTYPGIPLPGGMAELPVNWDVFTSMVIALVNTPFFANFMGTLDGAGTSAAKFDTFGPLPPGTAGIVMNYAYALDGPFDFASNPVGIEIVP